MIQEKARPAANDELTAGAWTAADEHVRGAPVQHQPLVREGPLPGSSQRWGAVGQARPAALARGRGSGCGSTSSSSQLRAERGRASVRRIRRTSQMWARCPVSIASRISAGSGEHISFAAASADDRRPPSRRRQDGRLSPDTHRLARLLASPLCLLHPPLPLSHHAPNRLRRVSPTRCRPASSPPVRAARADPPCSSSTSLPRSLLALNAGSSSQWRNQHVRLPAHDRLLQLPVDETDLVSSAPYRSDAVVLDLSPVAGASPVLATAKSPTTPDVTDGIQRVIRLALDQSGVQDKSKISAVNIGELAALSPPPPRCRGRAGASILRTHGRLTPCLLSGDVAQERPTLSTP